MPQIPAQQLRELARYVRTGLESGELTDDLTGVVLELCQRAEDTAMIEESRVVETFAETSSLLLDTFHELERKYDATDPRLVDIQERAHERGGEYASGVVEALRAFSDVLGDRS